MTRTRPAPVTPLVVQVSEESTGRCPLGDCGRAAYPHTIDGLDGYFDACPHHRLDVALDALWASYDDEPTVPFNRRPEAT